MENTTRPYTFCNMQSLKCLQLVVDLKKGVDRVKQR
jgi:hypothetical protein